MILPLLLISCFLPFRLGGEPPLSCYQCTGNSTRECPSTDLKPCSGVSDTCVLHIARNGGRELMVKRECGLGPCTFDDAMADKGLGFNQCDLTRGEVNCIICCKTPGCNKNQALIVNSNVVLLLLAVVLAHLS